VSSDGQPQDLTSQGPVAIDNFTLTRRLGAGAMGEVYLGRESITGRTIALKLINRRIDADNHAVKRFLREIEVMAQLVHPNVALYAGHGVWQKKPYLAMEHVDGPDLSSFLRDGARIPEEAALFLIIQVAEGLEYASQRTGLIHRDVKPGNIILDFAGQSAICSLTKAKIIDFGLAKFQEIADFDDIHFGNDRQGRPKDSTELAASSQVVGTPAYMPPEQVRGDRDITFAADMYSLGATLFHLIAGRTPYEGRTPALVMVSHLQDPVPDPTIHCPEMRSATRDLIMRAMAKDVQHRHRTWDQFISAARAALTLVQQGPTRRISRKPAEAPGTDRHIRVRSPEETARIVNQALGQAKPGQMTGSDALSQLLARRISGQVAPPKDAPPESPGTARWGRKPG
jgi:serine/threonine-protein kinase